MKVGKDKVVLMHYTLKNDAGDVIDSSDGADPLPFLQGHGNIIPGLESALEGSKVGDKLDVSIEPEEGYGLPMKDAIQEIPSSALQGVDEVKVGMQLQSQDKDGNAFLVTVTKIEDDKITVDGNHHWQVRPFTFQSASNLSERLKLKSCHMDTFMPTDNIIISLHFNNGQ